MANESFGNTWAYTPENRRHRKSPGKSPVKLALGTAAGLAVLTIASLYGEKIHEAVFQTKSRATLNGPIADHLEETDDCVESFEYGSLIPEDERSGENIMIAAHPNSKLFISAESTYEKYFESIMSPFLKALPEGTNVQIIITDDYKDECFNVASRMFPHLKFSILQLPYAGKGLEFIQDNVFASGRTDTQGRFQIARSSVDKEAFQRDTDCFWEPWFASMSKSEAAEYGVRLFADDFLAKKYPDQFVATNAHNKTSKRTNRLGNRNENHCR